MSNRWRIALASIATLFLGTMVVSVTGVGGKCTATVETDTEALVEGALDLLDDDSADDDSAGDFTLD